MDKILWEYLEMLAEQETSWYDWNRNLSDWRCFNTFCNYFLKVEEGHAKFLECTTPCEYGCPRQIMENSPSDIAAICPQEKAEPIPLKLKDILVYSLRHEDFHKAICAALQIAQPPECRRSECSKAWYLGEHSDITMAVYLTYHTAPLTLTESISSLCMLLRRTPFILMAPTGRGMTLEAQQILAENDSVFLSLADELVLRQDGSFKVVRSVSECMNPVLCKA